MKPHCPVWLLVLVLGVPWSAMADDGDLLSPDQLRASAERAENQSQQRAGRVDTNNPGAGIATKKPAEDAPLDVPQATDNYGAPSASGTGSKGSSPANASQQRAPSRRRSSENSSTPSSSSGSGSVMLDVVTVKRNRYGIRIGAVLYGELRRNISSAESGWAEIWLTRDAVGDHRTLPIGTQLFARKHANTATKRMELNFVHGNTPDGDEFDFDGQAYDDQDVAGLAGIVEDKSKEIVHAGVNKGLLAAGKGALQSMTAGKGVFGAAASQGGGSVLSDVGQHQEADADTGIIIYSYPQPVRVRVQKTF